MDGGRPRLCSSLPPPPACLREACVDGPGGQRAHVGYAPVRPAGDLDVLEGVLHEEARVLLLVALPRSSSSSSSRRKQGHGKEGWERGRDGCAGRGGASAPPSPPPTPTPHRPRAGVVGLVPVAVRLEERPVRVRRLGELEVHDAAGRVAGDPQRDDAGHVLAEVRHVHPRRHLGDVERRVGPVRAQRLVVGVESGRLVCRGVRGVGHRGRPRARVARGEEAAAVPARLHERRVVVLAVVHVVGRHGAGRRREEEGHDRGRGGRGGG